MRVPNVLQNDTVLDEIGKIRSRLDRFQAEISSGRRVRLPSDDPIAAASASRAQSRSDSIDRFRAASEGAQSKLVAVDNVLDQLERLTDEALSAAAAGRSGTATPEAFAALAEKVDGIRDEMMRLANTTYQGTYLFAGRQTRTVPFTSSGGVVSYQGDSAAPTVRVGEQTVVETSIPGTDLFVTGTDVFQVLADLRDALTAQDPTAVALQAQNLAPAADRFTQFRTRVGLTMNELERHVAALGSDSLREQDQISRDLDANLVESIANLNESNTALQAAVGAGGRLLSVSLLDVLG